MWRSGTPTPDGPLLGAMLRVMARGHFLSALILAVAVSMVAVCWIHAAEIHDEDVRVYTNKDLASLPERTSLPAIDDSSPPREVVRMGSRPAKRSESEEPSRVRATESRIADAERRALEARARVNELEKRLLAIRNPFMPRLSWGNHGNARVTWGQTPHGFH